MVSDSVIEELENELRQAMLTADVATLDRLLSDDLLFVTHTGALVTKEMDLATHRDGVLRLTVLDPSDEHVKRFADAAVVSVRMRVAGTFAGAPFAGTYRYLRVWARHEERWQVVAGQVTEIRE